MFVVDPDQAHLPSMASNGVHVEALAPSSWMNDCDTDRNHCSIMLRISFRESSVLLTGDEELAEEALFNDLEPTTLLQVGHHGSDTSPGSEFLNSLKPRYAVISVGEQGEGMNRNFCHPRALAVERLNAALAGRRSARIRAFNPRDKTVECRCSSHAHGCRKGLDSDWAELLASENMWVTARDRDVVLITSGDGQFARQTD